MMKTEYRHGTGKWMVSILLIMLSSLEPGQFMKVSYNRGKGIANNRLLWKIGDSNSQTLRSEASRVWNKAGMFERSQMFFFWRPLRSLRSVDVVTRGNFEVTCFFGDIADPFNCTCR
jgi:hypothetical protein